MDINYDYYKVFYHAAKYGSFSRAADVLMQGQPNVTKTVNNLENQLGCKLFVRSKKGVTLTREGEALFEHVQIAFEHLDLGERSIRIRSDLLEGNLSVAATETALQSVAIPALAGFKADYPNVKVRIANYTNDDAVLALKNGLADIALLTVNENSDNTIRLTEIKKYKELLCCKKGYYKGGNPFDMPFISLNKKTYNYRIIMEYFSKIGISREPDIEVAIIDQILPLVKSGAGVGFIPDILANELIAAGEIEQISIKNPPPARTISLAEDKKRGSNLVCATFIKYLKTV